MRRFLLINSLVALCVVCGVVSASAHSERPIESPIRPGPVPDINRVNPTHLVVCKPSSQPTAAQLTEIQSRLATATGDALVQAQADEAAWHRNDALFGECCFEHIQQAVNAAGDNTDILVMPGYYREEFSRAQPTTGHGDLPSGAYSYEYHAAHPNDANLIGIIGKKNITIEGTGSHPEDVIIDAGFVKDVGIRCDRCQGFIARNFWQRNANEHGVYTVDSDGYVYDRVIGSFSKEYELFAFASDNGLMTDCDAYGGGDSGFYIGGAPDTHSVGRFSQIIRQSKMHHSALGFSGTQGNSVQITDCDVYDNAIGISFDSENDHPNFPQRFAVIENNNIHDNNFDIYAATSDVPARGPAYNFFRYPVGTGLWIIGGEDNIVRNNRIYNNSRFGVILAGNPLERPRLARVFRNQFIDNLMGVAAGNGAGANSTAFPPGGDYPPGGSDFLWDETGDGNCFQPVASLKTDPDPIPNVCPSTNKGSPLPLLKANLLLACSLTQVPGSDPPQYQTTDTGFVCPWGQLNFGPYESSAEAQCGNGEIDAPAEDCDSGEDSAPNLGDQTCASLGHGTGTLACDDHCQWDFNACSITALPSPTPRAGCPVAAPSPTATAVATASATPSATNTIPPPTATPIIVDPTFPPIPTPRPSPTVTSPPSPTVTPRLSPTPTATVGLAETIDSGCAVVPVRPGRRGALGLVLVPVALLFLRRRK